jgi:rhodanese-related sulfurtransferase
MGVGESVGYGVNPQVRSIDEVLSEARGRLSRVDPQDAHERYLGGALLVDIRYELLRRRDGVIPGALIVERNELEWRLDPLCDYRLPQAAHHELDVLVLCNEGYASSLAALSLQQLGLRRATDVIGGFQAWAAAGLPVVRPRAQCRQRTVEPGEAGPLEENL